MSILQIYLKIVTLACLVNGLFGIYTEYEKVGLPRERWGERFFRIFILGFVIRAGAVAVLAWVAGFAGVVLYAAWGAS